MESSTAASLKTASEIFNNFTVGLSACVAVFLGIFSIFKLIPDYLKNQKKKNVVETLRNHFPREKLNKTFKLVDTERAQGKIYLIEKDVRYWIQSSPTFLELNFFWDDVKRITVKEFETYKEGPGILTSGTPGR